VPKKFEAEAALANCRALINQIMPGFLRKSSSSMSHRRQSFCFILSLPLLLSQSPHHGRESVGRRKIALNYRWR
jgi:hypothetical protein